MASSFAEIEAAELVRTGFGVARGLLNRVEVEEIRLAFMGANRDGPIPGLSEIHGGHGAYSADDPLAFYPRMMMPHLHDELAVGPLALRYLIDPRFRPYLATLLGGEPIGVQTMFYFKPPGARGQELHQDNFYLRVQPGTCAAAWIALDDADEENGGMQVVPGTHEYEIVCPETANADTSFTTDFVRPPLGTEAAPVDLRAGDVLFFNGSLIHGSTPNRSRRRFRRALICHYIPEGTAVSQFYSEMPRRFDGSVVEVFESSGGGPCGTAEPESRH